MTKRQPSPMKRKSTPRSETRRPQRSFHARLYGYDDEDDSPEIPDMALGGGKE